MRLETNLEYPLEKKSLDNEDGTFEGYLSVWNDVDRQQDVVDKGAWTVALDPLPLFYRHNRDEPLGWIAEHKEDDYGLWVKGQFDLTVKRAQEIHSLAKKGIMRLSPGYLTQEEYFSGPIRHIKAGEIYEGTITPFPANLNAGFTSVKEEDFEEDSDYDEDADFELEGKEAGGGLPLADKGTSWDAGAARAALRKWATGANGEVDMAKYCRGFLVCGKKMSDCKFPIATIINGRLTAVPNAIRAALGRLNQGHGIASDKSRMASVLNGYRKRLGWDTEGKEEDPEPLKVSNELILRYKELKEALEAIPKQQTT